MTHRVKRKPPETWLMGLVSKGLPGDIVRGTHRTKAARVLGLTWDRGEGGVQKNRTVIALGT